MENLGFAVGDHVIDEDGYEARIAEIVPDIHEARLDYSGFASDVPAEADVWPLDELRLADEAAEDARAAEVAERYGEDDGASF